MNQVAEENFQNAACRSVGSNMRNRSKKAKEPSEETNAVSLSNQEDLCETLDNTLNINRIINNVTNGMSDHSHDEGSIGATEVESCLDKPPAELPAAVVGEERSEGAVTEEAAAHAINSVIDDALENLQSAIDKKELIPHYDIEIISYESELQMPEIMRLIQKDLSEPYSIYTYRYFIHNWPKLCFLATHEGKCIGAIVCKLDMHRNVQRGYIAMLAVDKKYRSRKIGSRLAQKAIKAMINDNADEVVLETEITNKPALKLYENLGFVRDKRLFRYYLNGVDALRLKLWLR